MEKISTMKLVILIIVLLALTSFTYTQRYRDAEMPNLPDLGLIPEEIGGYNSTTNQLAPRTIKMLGVDTTLARNYYNLRKQEIEFYLGFFLKQQKHSQIHSPKHCYPGSGWDIQKENSIILHPEGKKISAKTILISNKQERRMIVYWFYINKKIITNEFALKWEQMKCSLQGRAQPAVFIRFSVILPHGKEKNAERDITEFIELLQPFINLALNQNT